MHDYADSGSFHTGSVTDAYCAGVQRTQRGEDASYRHGRGSTVGISRLRPQSPAPRDPSVSARNDRFVIHESDVLMPIPVANGWSYLNLFNPSTMIFRAGSTPSQPAISVFLPSRFL